MLEGRGDSTESSHPKLPLVNYFLTIFCAFTSGTLYFTYLHLFRDFAFPAFPVGLTLFRSLLSPFFVALSHSLSLSLLLSRTYAMHVVHVHPHFFVHVLFFGSNTRIKVPNKLEKNIADYLLNVFDVNSTTPKNKIAIFVPLDRITL